MEKQSTGAIGAYVRGYAAAAGLQLSQERLTELEPEVASLFADMAKLWTIPLEGAEMAVSFGVESTSHD